MRYSIAAAAALAATASACNTCHYNGTVSYTTEVVTDYTTYCPYATHVSFNGVTYTVTEATTLTVTNCPCTITKPVPVTYSSAIVVPTTTPVYTTPVVVPSPVYSTPVVSVPVVSTPVVTVPVSSPVLPSYVNSTVPLPTGTGSPASSVVVPPAASFTGAGSRIAASGASLVAVMGLAAFFL